VPVKFIDTAGWEPVGTANSPAMIEKMMIQTRKALFDSDLAFFLLDVRRGVTVADEQLAEYLRRERVSTYPNLKDIILVGNKAESSFLGDISNEVYRLDMGEPVLISAEHNEGLVDLYSRLRESIPESYIEEAQDRYEKRLERHAKVKEDKLKDLKALELKSGEDWNLKEWERAYDKLNPPDLSDYDSDSEASLSLSLADPREYATSPDVLKKAKAVQLSIIGRPNVGKSTMVNCLLGEDRVITDQQAGTTRDSVYIDHVHRGKKVKLVDTAGLHRRNKGTVMKLVEEDVERAIKFSHAVIFLFDASEGVSPSELDMARKVIDEGRILLAVGNKWDKVPKEDKEKFANYYADLFFRKISLKGLNIVLTSAVTKYNTKNMLDEIIQLYERWNSRVSTGLLNRWLDSFKKVQNLPTEAGALLKIKYITQIKARPPTFYVFVNDRSLMKENYLKNFTNSLCKEFGLSGVPVRILFRDKHLKAKKIHKPSFKVRKASEMLKSATEKLKTSKKKPVIIS
jgi:GTPase